VFGYDLRHEEQRQGMNAITPAVRPRRGTDRRGPGQPRPRAMFYSHDGFGLGHIRITLAMAQALSERRPDASLLALTGSPQAHAYELPPNFDYIKMPTAAKGTLYADLPAHRELPLTQTGVWFVREALIRRATAAYSPDLVIVDHAAAGHLRELSRALRELRAAKPEAVFVLELTDIINDGPSTIADWKKSGAYTFMDELYDHVLIFGSPDVFDMIQEYEFSDTTAAKTRYVGYMRRHDRLVPPEEIRARLGAQDMPLVVVTTGGGADGARDIQAYLRAVRSRALDGVYSFVVTGPLLDSRARAELEELAGGLPDLTLVPFTNELVSYLNAADLVVSKGGYNAMCEVMSLGKRTVVIPRSTMWQEQVVRAERFSALGLVTMLHPNDMTPDMMATTVINALHDPPPAVMLDFEGLTRAGELFAELLPGGVAP
jgi:predicted glycosyltransferase